MFGEKKNWTYIVNKKEDKELEQYENTKFKLTINKARKFENAEMNPDFFHKIFGDQVNTEEEFREKMRETLTKQLDTESKSIAKAECKKKILADLNFSLPKDFLIKLLMRNGTKLSDEEIEKQYPEFESSMKWQLVTDHIVTKYELSVSDETLYHFVTQYIFNYSYSRGQYQSYEAIMAQVDKIMKSEEDKHYFESMKLEEIVMDHLLTILPFNKQQLAYDEYLKTLNNNSEVPIENTEANEPTE